MIELANRTAEPAADSARSDAPTSINEAARIAALHEYGILDTPREAAFDDITRVATVSVCADVQSPVVPEPAGLVVVTGTGSPGGAMHGLVTLSAKCSALAAKAGLP